MMVTAAFADPFCVTPMSVRSLMTEGNPWGLASVVPAFPGISDATQQGIMAKPEAQTITTGRHVAITQVRKEASDPEARRSGRQDRGDEALGWRHLMYSESIEEVRPRKID